MKPSLKLADQTDRHLGKGTNHRSATASKTYLREKKTGFSERGNQIWYTPPPRFLSRLAIGKLTSQIIGGI
ncbi:hypothetical protein EUTSA_v10003432mg [Eutrema salsugineum]|uniref:Uncharacterized protein n=1 Tax=Eutrema salsugineum TaxID=72664 RepID=V4LQL4_EUTSA|nr:hypothetical protein EUTSA_v10003432mg [Eutrema salsugineum]